MRKRCQVVVLPITSLASGPASENHVHLTLALSIAGSLYDRRGVLLRTQPPEMIRDIHKVLPKFLGFQPL